MALNTQKLLPGSNSKSNSALVVSPKNKSSLVKVDKPKIRVKQESDPLINILKKTILINKNIESINERLLKKQSIKRTEAIRSRRRTEESRLESDKKKRMKKKKGDKSPQMSFLDRIRDFFTYTFLGWLFDKTAKYIPQLLKIVEVLGVVGEFLANAIGTIGNALITFIDKGYELYDRFKLWKKENIDGTNFEKIFNPVVNNLETFANLALIAGLLATTSGGGSNDRLRSGNNRRRGGNIRRRGGNTRTRGGRVTESGNRRGRFRNPFRRRPSVTGTGGDRLGQRIRNLNPFRDKPNTTGTRGDRLGQQLRNINPLRRRAPVTAGSGTRSAITFDAIKNAISRGKFGVNQLKQLARPILKPLQAVLKRVPVIGALIDFGINTLIFGDSPGEAAFKAVFAGVIGAIGGALGSVFPGPGTIVGATLGGIAGDRLGQIIYNQIFKGGSQKKPSQLKLNQFSRGGTTGSDTSERDTNDENLQITDKPINITEIDEIDDVSRLFQKSKDTTEFQSPYDFIKDSSTILAKKVPYYGPLFNLFGKLLLGNRTENRDVEVTSYGISSLIGNLIVNGFIAGKTLQEILANLPRLVYDMTQRFLISFSNDVLSQLQKQLALKSIYDSELVKNNEDDKKENVVTAIASSLGLSKMLGLEERSETNPEKELTSAGQASGAIKADTDIVASMGFAQEDWELFRNTVAQIESGGKYDIAGGSGGHYDGRYQLGAAAKTDGARYAGIADPGHGPAAREAFRKNADLQEKLFAGFTKANHTYLMGIPEYRDANAQRKLQILGYAHNQGMGGAANWMRTGIVGADGFGTKGTKYTDSIAAEFRKRDSVQSLKGGGNLVKIPQPRSFRRLQEKTSYENSMVILVKREKEIVYVPINNSRASSIIVNNNSLSSEKFNSFIK